MANEQNDAELHEIMDAADAEKGTGTGGTGGTGDAASNAAAEAREASSKGWVPKDKYTGDPAKWVDAATFIDRGKKFNHNLQAEVAALKAQVGQFKKTAQDFQKYHEDSLKAKDDEVKAAILDLRKQHKTAVRDGEDDEAIALEDRIDALKDESASIAAKLKEKPADAPAGPDPEMQAWIADGNEWFTTDVKLQQYAVTMASELIAKGETLRGRPFMNKITDIMKEEFPAKFGNQNRARPGSAEAGGRGPAPAGGRSERDLPAVDRQLMNEFIAAGYTTKEKFLAGYRWS